MKIRRPAFRVYQCGFTLLLGFALCAPLLASGGTDPYRSAPSSSGVGAFVANAGQWPEFVLYRAETAEGAVWITRSGFTVERLSEDSRSAAGANGTALAALEDGSSRTVELIHYAYRGSNPEITSEGEGQLANYFNFFLGNNASRWRSRVPAYRSVTLKSLYPNIDIRYTTDALGRVTYEFALKAGANTGNILIERTGALNARLSGTSSSEASASPVDLPVSKEPELLPCWTDGSLPTQFANAEVSASATASPNALALEYSTHVGTANGSRAQLAVDDSGRAYIICASSFANYPTQNAYQTDQPGTDVTLSRLAPDGSSFEYSTYLGGSDFDNGMDVAVDASGSAYLTGFTFSVNFPRKNAYQLNAHGMSEGFVTKFSPAGDSLIYSTYLGGTDGDQPWAIAVDASGSAYVTGTTNSFNFPSMGPAQTDQPGYDGFVTKYTPGGSITYSTCLGGNGEDGGHDILVDGTGRALVCGRTGSSNYPVVNPPSITQTLNNDDFTLTRLNASGNTIDFSAQIGGSRSEDAFGITLDPAGEIIVTGWTLSNNFPVVNAWQPLPTDSTTIVEGDGFLLKLSATGQIVVYSTYLSSPGDDWGYSVSAYPGGQVAVLGVTYSASFPVPNPLLPAANPASYFLMMFKNSGAGPIWGTFLGGTKVEGDYGGVWVDSIGDVYMAGQSHSVDYPTQNPIPGVPLTVNEGYAVTTKISGCLIDLTGDVSPSGTLTSADVIGLVNFVFKGGAALAPCAAIGDINCSGSVTSADIILLVNHVFKGGPPPCDACTLPLAAWGCE